MSDAELYALSVLVAAETAGKEAANQQRIHRGESLAYVEENFAFSPKAERLRMELEKRGVR